MTRAVENGSGNPVAKGRTSRYFTFFAEFYDRRCVRCKNRYREFVCMYEVSMRKGEPSLSLSLDSKGRTVFSPTVFARFADRVRVDRRL